MVNRLSRYLLVGALACGAIMLVAMMILEYRFFKHQAHQMMQLQGEYRSYMQTAKSIVDDYAKTKERLVLLEELNKGEKKNAEMTGTASEFDTPFPEGVRVYSSEDNDVDPQDNFLVVNRELEYLKEATLAHIKEVELEHLLQRVDLDEWQDYSERMLAKKEPQPRRKRKAGSYATTFQGRKTVPVAPSTHKRDMTFSWPIDRSHFWLSSFYGPRKFKNGKVNFHGGIDMAAIKGTSVTAAASGIVVEARSAPGYGNTVLIAHNGKYKTRYAHLKSMFVKVGQPIHRGGLIGTVGATGYVRSAFGRDPSHLHFELYVFGKKVNPMHFLA